MVQKLFLTILIACQISKYGKINAVYQPRFLLEYLVIGADVGENSKAFEAQV